MVAKAQGTAGKDSDIDVGVLLDGTMTANKLWQLAQDLAVKLMRDVDLVDLRRASTVLQKEIIVNGQWLLRTDKLACDLFDTHVISMYQDLQHNRRYLLKDLKHRIYHG